MAYDERLAIRIRAALGDLTDVVEKKMFGGIAFMVSGSMAVGIVGEDLMARVGDERYEQALSRPHARPMNFTGRPMKGFVFVGAKGIATTALLRKWITEAVAFAQSPEQQAKAAKGAMKRRGVKRKKAPKRATRR